MPVLRKCGKIYMLKILLAILIFGFLILIHEFGHYIMARIFKVGIKEFSVGMGPKLFQKKSKKTGIAYSLRLLPIGGYVSMDGENEDSESENAFYKKPIIQRFLILVAGAFMNILVGIIITCIIVVNTSGLFSAEISAFAENAMSEKSGLMVGDKIVKIGNQSVHTGYEAAYEIMHDAVGKTDITVIRNGVRTVIHDVEFYTFSESGVLMAQRDFNFAKENKTVKTVIKNSFYRSVTSVRMIWDSLIDLIRGKYGIESMSGPIGITGAIGDAVATNDGGETLLNISALIALNLGIFNLLPFPALDGGKIFLLLVELIRRKPLKREVEGYLDVIGFALLLLLMVFVTFQDITRLIN